MGIDWWFANIRSMGFACALLGMLGCLGCRIWGKKPIEEKILGSVLVCGIAGYSAVQGASLTYCAFDVARLSQMPDYPTFVGIGGFVSLVAAGIGLYTVCKKAKDEA